MNLKSKAANEPPINGPTIYIQIVPKGVFSAYVGPVIHCITFNPTATAGLNPPPDTGPKQTIASPKARQKENYANPAFYPAFVTAGSTTVA